MISSLTTIRNLYLEKLPIYLIFYVTSRCNFRCPFCFYLDNIEDKIKHELTLEEIEKISKSFGKLVQLSLAGGEPFLRKDLPEICEIFIRNNSPGYITIPTNASLSDRVESVVSKLVKIHSNIGFRIPLSVDGIGKQHDKVRGVPGSFEKLLETYRRLIDIRKKNGNLIVDVNTTFSADNQDKVPSIIDWVMKNLDVNNHSITYIRGNLRDKALMKTSADKYRRCIETLINQPKKEENRLFSSLIRSVFEESWDTIAKTIETDKFVLPCLSGKKLIVVSEKGDVFPCEILRKKFGNLRESGYDISNILFTKPSNDLKKWIRDTKCYCTFECAVNTNVVYRIQLYPRMIRRTIRNYIIAHK